MKNRTPHFLTAENDGLQNLVYVHIPKTGGNTMNSSLIFQNLGHQHAFEYRQHTCFSTVRNPFEWLVSFWHSNWLPPGTILAHGSIIPPAGCVVHRYRVSIQDVWPKLETFLYEFNSFQNSCSHEWNEYEKWHLEKKHVPLFSHRHLQVCQTFDRLDSPGEKRSFASFYIRLERLEDVINKFPPNKIRKNRPQRAGSSQHKDYRYYYDTKLIDHITHHRKQELDLLGYDFEGPTDNLSVFKINKPFLWK